MTLVGKQFVVIGAAGLTILTSLYVSALRGHFAVFGTFWGRAFFSSFYELHHWLHGNFYAFDRFAGLSEPDPREKAFTNGDFSKGAYGFNHASFCALSDILGLPRERIVTVPGFFDASLTPENAAKLGIAPKSLSVCRKDCDLIDPTLSVLNFTSPLLDDGALIYFDDWRLCRADPNLGKRGAVLRWLKANPSFDLVDFPSIHWQHQWFIFHRGEAQATRHAPPGRESARSLPDLASPAQRSPITGSTAHLRSILSSRHHQPLSRSQQREPCYDLGIICQTWNTNGVHRDD
jgi:hypothetical protein